jgi:hypothetical protein
MSCLINKRQTLQMRAPVPTCRVFVASFLLSVALCVSSFHTWAQTQGSGAAASTPAPKIAKSSSNPAAPVSNNQHSKPSWSELSETQKVALKPLATQWNSLSEAQKRKWIKISENFGTLTSTEQTKMHTRMLSWVTLSPQERSQARLNFAETNKLSPAEKTSTWEAYQALSPEDKQRLVTQSNAKIPGASTPIKPVPPQKLTVVPVAQPSTRLTPKIAVSSGSVQNNTLLPQPTAPLAPPAAALAPPSPSADSGTSASSSQTSTEPVGKN